MFALERLRRTRGLVPRAPALELSLALAVLSLGTGCAPQRMLRGQAAAMPLSAPSTQPYTLQPGETLWRVARRHGMSADELARKNGIADPTKVRAGTVLTVPAPAAPAAESPATGRAAPSSELTAALSRAGGKSAPAPTKKPTDPTPPAGPAATGASPAPGPSEPAALPATPGVTAPPSGPGLAAPPPASPGLATPPPDPHAATPATAPPPAASDDDREARPPASYPLRWPLEGPVVARFGARDGAAHDGIDLTSTSGTPVKAAAAGRVIFAGRQGSYGNLVIVRHEGGLLTVYAHLSVTLVRRGQTVALGDAVGRLGGTATAPAPLHFEVREGVVARNPLKFLPP